MRTVLFIFLLLPFILIGQIEKGTGIAYFDSIPNVAPLLPKGTEIAFGIKTKKLYRWDRTCSCWIEIKTSTDSLARTVLASGLFNQYAVPFGGSTGKLDQSAAFQFVLGQLQANSFATLGSAGAGYLGLSPQSSVPATPASGIRVYADASGRFGWIGTNGYTRVFDASGITANRTFKLQNKTYTLADSADVASLSVSLPSTYFPLLGGTLTGTGGAGFVGFPSQTVSPGTPTSGLNIYAQGSSFNWKGTDGHERQFASTLTGGRTYTLQNKSYTLADQADVTTLQSTVAGLGSTYFPLAGGSITGTGGAGFFGAISQSSAPSTPASGFRFYADASGRLAWKGANGFVRVFDGTANTADRAYTLPDASGVFDLIGVSQSFTGRKTFSGDNLLAFAPNSSAGTHIIGWVEPSGTPTTGDRYGVYSAAPGYNAKGGIVFRVADGATATYDIVFQTTNNTLAGTPGTISGAVQDVLWVSNQGNVIVNGSTNTYSTRLAVNGEMSNSSFRTQSATILRMNPDNATSRIVGGGFGGSSVFSIHGGTGDFNGFTDVGQSPKITFSSTSGLNLQAGNQDAGKSLTISFASASSTGYSVTTPYTFLNSSVTFTPQGSGAAGFVYSSTTRPSHPIPNMTTAQIAALTGMVTGDLAFNTNDVQYQFYNGSAYSRILAIGTSISTNSIPVFSSTLGSITSSNAFSWSDGTPGILTMGSNIGVRLRTLSGTFIDVGTGTNGGGFSIGFAASSTHRSMAFGREATTTADGQVIIGGAFGGNALTIDNIWFNSSGNTGTVTSGTVNIGIGASSGTDRPSGSLRLKSSASTGAGTPGDIILSTSNVGTTGTTVQTIVDRWFMKGGTGAFSNIANPSASALVEFSSTTQGFLIPRATDAQISAISSPALALQAFSTTTERINVKRTSGFFQLAYTQDVRRDTSYQITNTNLDISGQTANFKNRYHTVRIATAVTAAATANNVITMPVPHADLLGINFKVSVVDVSGDSDISQLSFGTDGVDGYLSNGDGTYATAQNLYPGLGVYVSVAWDQNKSAYRWFLQ